MQQESLSLLAFQNRFRTEKACQKHLFQLRWPQGYRCPRCQHDQAFFHRTRHLYACKACGYQASLMAGTIFHTDQDAPAEMVLDDLPDGATEKWCLHAVFATDLGDPDL